MRLLNTKTFLWFMVTTIISISLPIINTGYTQTVQSVALYFSLTGITLLFYFTWNSEINKGVLLYSYLISSSMLFFVLFFQEIVFLNSTLLSFQISLILALQLVNALVLKRKKIITNS